jgi:hypothetical protein
MAAVLEMASYTNSTSPNQWTFSGVSTWKIYGSNSLSGFTEIINASTSSRISVSDYILSIYSKSFTNSQNTAFSYIGITFNEIVST